MENIGTKEIKGISARDLIYLLSSIIAIEFTILMSYNSIMNNQNEFKLRVENFEKNQTILMQNDADERTRLKILEVELNSLNQK